MDTPLKKYFEYCEYEIDGWDLMAWAVQLDPDSIEDKEALQELIELDDFYANGYYSEVEKLVHRTIPEAERKCKGELFILDALKKLKEGAISSAEFISKFVKLFLYEIEQEDEECSDWIETVFHENNAYGFFVLEEMSSTELLVYLQEKIDNQEDDLMRKERIL